MTPAVTLRSKTVQVDGEKLVDLRARKNWTQEKLADKAVVLCALSKISSEAPTQRSTLARLADALGVSARDLMFVAAPAQTTPYCGLSGFTEADAKYFCGRDRVVASLVSKLAQNKLLQISGPSGSGKYRVVCTKGGPQGRPEVPQVSCPQHYLLLDRQEWKAYLVTREQSQLLFALAEPENEDPHTSFVDRLLMSPGTEDYKVPRPIELCDRVRQFLDGQPHSAWSS